MLLCLILRLTTRDSISLFLPYCASKQDEHSNTVILIQKSSEFSVIFTKYSSQVFRRALSNFPPVGRGRKSYSGGGVYSAWLHLNMMRCEIYHFVIDLFKKQHLHLFFHRPLKYFNGNFNESIDSTLFTMILFDTFTTGKLYVTVTSLV